MKAKQISTTLVDEIALAYKVANHARVLALALHALVGATGHFGSCLAGGEGGECSSACKAATAALNTYNKLHDAMSVIIGGHNERQ
jgi:hypothetical protein